MSEQMMSAVIVPPSWQVEPGGVFTPDSGRESAFAADVARWLARQGSAAHAVRWGARGAIPGKPVVSADRLAGLIGGLVDTGSWAVVRRPNAELWSQCMSVPGGWIVEVNGIPGPDCFVRRVQGSHSRWRDRLRGRKMVRDQGRPMAVYLPQDVINDPQIAAGVMWTWLRGGLLAGFELREV